MSGCSVEKATTRRLAPLPGTSTTSGLTCPSHDLVGSVCQTSLSKKKPRPSTRRGFSLYPRRRLGNPEAQGRSCAGCAAAAKRCAVSHPSGAAEFGALAQTAAQFVLASPRSIFVSDSRHWKCRAPLLRFFCCSWASSSAGRAPRSQRGGRGFESPLVHHLQKNRTLTVANNSLGHSQAPAKPATEVLLTATKLAIYALETPQ